MGSPDLAVGVFHAGFLGSRRLRLGVSGRCRGGRVGDAVEKEQELGKSGMTGLAGGDHLHFTMLVNGKMVNPVEWWDPHWIQDRILRKLRMPGA